MKLFRHSTTTVLRRGSSRRGNHRDRIAVIVLAASLIGATQTPHASAAKIRLSQPNVGVTALPLWIATSEGLFKKYSVEVEPVYVRNSTIQMMALTTNEVQLSHTSGAPTLSAAAAGHELKIIATFGQGVYWDIVAKVKAEDLVDERIYRKLEESQFIDRLYYKESAAPR